MNSTLLLNADGTPVSMLPLSAVSWQDAMRLLYADDAIALHNYEDWDVHSPRVAVPMPAVLILRDQVVARSRLAAGASPRRSFVFLRDNFICQYCSEQFTARRLTLDHVVPRSAGGKSLWENLATACGKCNTKRGTDQRIRPLTKPVRPTYGLLLKNMRHFPILIPHETWNYYLGWPDDRVKVASPQQKTRMSSENFDFSMGMSISYDALILSR